MPNDLDQFAPKPINQAVDSGEVDLADSLQSMWFLLGRMQPTDPIRQVSIHTTLFLVGRSTNVALSLPSKTVSSVHAEFITDGDELILRDLGSTNGTFVNGQRIADPVALNPDDLVQFSDIAFRVAMQSASINMGTICEDVYDQAMTLVQFDRLMNEEAVTPHYQPIVILRSGETIAYEVLGRSQIIGLESPAAMFSAAAQLNMEAPLSQMLRRKGIELTDSLSDSPHLFVNTHPAELKEPELIESMRAIRDTNPSQDITLEIHEAAISDVAALKELRGELLDLNIGLAFDDFGAGQTRLLELTEIHPDYVKFDMSLIRNIHMATDEHKQMIAALVGMIQEMGVVSLAEGVESQDESRVCCELGFSLAQGYYFGKPAPLQMISIDLQLVSN